MKLYSLEGFNLKIENNDIIVIYNEKEYIAKLDKHGYWCLNALNEGGLK